MSQPPRRTTFVRALRPVLGLLVLAALLAMVGVGPFLTGLRAVDPWVLMAALAVTGVTTLCCARRWILVCRSLDVVPPTLPAAVAAYYRSQFLNATLPGGVLGDVHRGVRHGRDQAGVLSGLRAVVWERSLGLVVQVAVTALAVLLLVPAARGPVLAGTLVLSAAGTLFVARGLPADLGRLLASPRRVREVVLLSVAALAGHAVLFVVAARTAGVSASGPRLAALALVVLLVSTVPASLAGWGPREGAAAWVFAVAGPGADQGVAASVVYGVMALTATLPGAVLLLRRPRPAPVATAEPLEVARHD